MHGIDADLDLRLYNAVIASGAISLLLFNLPYRVHRLWVLGMGSCRWSWSFLTFFRRCCLHLFDDPIRCYFSNTPCPLHRPAVSHFRKYQRSFRRAVCVGSTDSPWDTHAQWNHLFFKDARLQHSCDAVVLLDLYCLVAGICICHASGTVSLP